MNDISRKKMSNVQPWKVRIKRVKKLAFPFILFFHLLGGVHATVFIKPAVTRNLFNVQMLAGACWKGSALQNMGALSEFR